MPDILKLLPHHVEHLHASALSDDTIRRAGLYSETSPDSIAALLNRRKPSKNLAPAIVFPYHDPRTERNGYCRTRPDTPRKQNGKPVKYESPVGQSNQVYFPPSIEADALDDPSVELTITEGEKKALAISQWSVPCIGLVGVFGWKAGRREQLLMQLERISWQGRKVVLIFDSDIASKPSIQDAEARLAKLLQDRGAEVRCVRIPEGPKGDDGEPAKVGADDFIAQHGAGEFARLLSEAIAPPAVEGAETKDDARAIDPGPEAKSFLAATERDGVSTLRFWLGDWWKWQAGAYRKQDSQDVRARVLRALDRRFRNIGSGTVSCVLDHLKAWSILSSDIEPGTWIVDDPTRWNPRDLLVTQNELIHLPTMERRPVTPRLFSTAALDFSFESDPQRPDAWLNFLDTIWPADGEAIETLQDFFGYLLTPDTRMHKILLLVGPPRSGKGTIARLIRELAGARNVVGPTLASFAGNFALEGLLGKSVAIISDARLSGRTDQGIVVERLLSISGEDTLTIDRKYNAHVTCKLPTRIVILSNELPRLADTSGAMASRFVVLRMRHSFLGREDTALFERLRPELPAILWWGIDGWSRLNQRGHFVQPASGKELLQEMADLQSPIGAFVRARCQVDEIREVKRADIYAAFRKWSEEQGRKRIEDEATFGRGIRAAVPTIVDSHHRDEWGKLVRYYAGIGLV